MHPKTKRAGRHYVLRLFLRLLLVWLLEVDTTNERIGNTDVGMQIHRV